MGSRLESSEVSATHSDLFYFEFLANSRGPWRPSSQFHQLSTLTTNFSTEFYPNNSGHDKKEVESGRGLNIRKKRKQKNYAITCITRRQAAGS